MAGITFNPKPQRRVPINRNNLFYSEEDYLFETDLGKNYIEQDMGQTIVLYQVNMSETQIDVVYGETKPNAMRFLPPIEVPCVYEIADPELKSYDKSKNLATYLKTGKLTVGVYQASLDELGVDEEISSFVLPLGMTVNMNGTAIMQVVATIFIAAVGGYPLTLPMVFTISLLAVVASVGTPAAPGAGAIILFTVLRET